MSKLEEKVKPPPTLPFPPESSVRDFAESNPCFAQFPPPPSPFPLSRQRSEESGRVRGGAAGGKEAGVTHTLSLLPQLQKRRLTMMLRSEINPPSPI